MITIAIPKGRLLPPSLRLLQRAGLANSRMTMKTRRLIFDGTDNSCRFMVVRDSDVPAYVEYGAADVGIVGKDVIMEQERDVYEPLDLGFGYCRLVVAEPRRGHGSVRSGSTLRVATKYPNITERHFSRKGIPVEVIKLYGSIELAPLAGLADQIVDLVESGRTFSEHHLVEVEEIAESTARLITNRASLKLRHEEVRWLIRRFKNALKEKKKGRRQ